MLKIIVWKMSEGKKFTSEYVKVGNSVWDVNEIIEKKSSGISGDYFAHECDLYYKHLRQCFPFHQNKKRDRS